MERSQRLTSDITLKVISTQVLKPEIIYQVDSSGGSFDLFLPSFLENGSKITIDDFNGSFTTHSISVKTIALDSFKPSGTSLVINKNGRTVFTYNSLTRKWQHLSTFDYVSNDDLATWTGSSNINTVGTITNGDWRSSVTRITNLTQNGFVKTTGSNGTLVIDTNTYLTQNQNITLTGDVTGFGNTTINTSISNATVTSKLLTGLNITGSGITAADSILSAFGKIQNQLNGLAGGIMYQGAWNATTNTPHLTSSTGTNGYFYVVNVAGSTTLNGESNWNPGDWVVFNGTTWQKVDNTDSVTSVNGQLGNVNLTTDNIPEGTFLYFTNARVNTQVATYTGDVTLTGTVFSIGSSKVTNAMLAGSIDLTTKVTGILPVSNGGSGASTLTGILKGNGTSAFSIATSGTDYIAGGVGTTNYVAKFSSTGVLANSYINDDGTSGNLSINYVTSTFGNSINNNSVGVTRTGANSSSVYLRASTNNPSILFSSAFGTGGRLSFTDGTTEFLQLWGTGNVSLKTSSISDDGYKLSVQGTGYFSGNVGISGNLGVGTTTANALLQLANTITNRKITLYDANNNDHQFYGFGINAGVLRFQVDGSSSAFEFYYGSSSSTSALAFRIGSSSVTIPSALSLGSPLTVPNGGTGLSTITTGYIPYGNGTNSLNTSANLVFSSNILNIGGSSSAIIRLWNTAMTPQYIDINYNNTALNINGSRILAGYSQGTITNNLFGFTSGTNTFYDLLSSQFGVWGYASVGGSGIGSPVVYMYDNGSENSFQVGKVGYIANPATTFTPLFRIVTNGNTSILSTTASSSTTTGALVVSGGVGVAGSIYATTFVGALTGNATTATTLQTARTINGTSFDGSANITVTAAAGTLTGTTLNSSVVSSSLTSVGTISTGVWSGTKISEIYGGTNQSTYTTGDILYASASNTLSKLTIGSSAQILVVNTGIPSWQTVSGDIAITNSGVTAIGSSKVTNTMLAGSIAASKLVGTDITTVGTLTSGTWNATTIGATYGGTSFSTYTLGDTIYSSASNTLSKLSGNTTTTNKFLSQTGNGTVSAAPTWATLVAGDIPSLAASKITSGTFAKTFIAADGAEVTSYTSSGSSTYTIPSWARTLYVVCSGAGGGGGSGRASAASTNQFGGGGGGSGAISELYIKVADLTGNITVVVGAGGTGGAAVASTNNGNNGNNGGDTTIVNNSITILKSSGGSGGSGGTASLGTGGAGGVIGDFIGVTGGASSITTAAALGTNSVNRVGGGGGGGGGSDSANNWRSGGNGGSGYFGLVSGGTAATAAGGTAATNGSSPSNVQLSGGGGGGGALGSGIRNGANGLRGGGGGGGSAGYGANSGAGGNGGSGWVIIFAYP